MKTIILLSFVFASFMATAQSLPFDFESDITTTDFVDFDGGAATVIANPQNNADNNSSMVAQIVRDLGTIWSGSKVEGSSNLDFSTYNTISMKVFTTAPVGTIVKFKLEGGTIAEKDIPTTVTGQWETLTWDFSGTAPDNNTVVFMFDYGNIGDGSVTSTFLFDDVQQGKAKLSVKPTIASTSNIYPNPSSDKWTITAPKGLIKAIEVLDSQGKRLESIQNNASTISLDASAYSPGIYLVKIYDGESFSTKRLIKK